MRDKVGKLAENIVRLKRIIEDAQIIPFPGSWKGPVHAVSSSHVPKIKIGDTYQQHGFRMHVFSSSIQIMDLAQAGKRGGKVSECSIYTIRNEDDTMRIAEQILGTTSYKEAESLAHKISKETGYPIQVLALRGVDVMPAEHGRIDKKGPHVSVTVNGPREASINDLDDQQNYSYFANFGGAGERAKFASWVRANVDEIIKKKFVEVQKMMERDHVAFSTHSGMD